MTGAAHDLIARLRDNSPQKGEELNHTWRRFKLERTEAAIEIGRLKELVETLTEQRKKWSDRALSELQENLRLKAEMKDLYKKLQDMHRRAQAAEGKLARQESMVRKVLGYMKVSNFRPHYPYHHFITWLSAALEYTRGRSGKHFDIDFLTREEIKKNKKGGET